MPSGVYPWRALPQVAYDDLKRFAILSAGNPATATCKHQRRSAVLPRVPPCRPGEFYLREPPPLRAVLDGLSGLGLLVVDDYADLDPSGRPGLGAHAHAAFGIAER